MVTLAFSYFLVAAAAQGTVTSINRAEHFYGLSHSSIAEYVKALIFVMPLRGW